MSNVFRSQITVHLLFHVIVVGLVAAAVSYRPLTQNTVGVHQEGSVVISAFFLITCYWRLQYKEKPMRLNWTLRVVSIIVLGVHVTSLVFLFKAIMSVVKVGVSQMDVTCERGIVSNRGPYCYSEDYTSINSFWVAKQPSLGVTEGSAN